MRNFVTLHSIFSIMKKLLVALFSFLVIVPVWAQNTDEGKYKDSGIDFFIGAGVYMPGKGTANYYNGSSANAQSSTGGNTLGYIFGNASWKEQIDRSIVEHNRHISLDNLKKYTLECPEDMRYSPSLYIQIGAKYRFNRNVALSIAYSFARCKAKDVFLLHYKTYEAGNEHADYLTYNLLGKENRSFIDLTFTYLFDTESIVEPFIEITGQFNFVRVKSFQAIIEGQEYNLLDVYQGSNYVANTQMQTFKVNQGGAGGGFAGAFGLKLKVSKVVSLDPVFFAGGSYINLAEPYKKFTFNYGALVRIVMNDSFFSKNN